MTMTSIVKNRRHAAWLLLILLVLSGCRRVNDLLTVDEKLEKAYDTTIARKAANTSLY